MTMILTIAQLDTAPSLDGQTKVVRTVHWRANKTDGTHNASSYGTVSLPEPTPEHPFVAFESLTLATVQGWMQSNGWDAAAVEAGLDAQLAQLANPPIVGMTPPWQS